MVKQRFGLYALILSVLLPGGAIESVIASDTPASSFEVRIDRDSLEYGKSLVLILSSERAEPDLNSVALAALTDDFAIEPIERQTDTPGAKQQQRWRLYPRRVGQLEIPAMNYRSQQSRPIPVSVTTAIDPRDNQPIRIETGLPDSTPWLHQALYLKMTLETGSPIIVLKREMQEYDAVQIQELETMQTPVEAARQRYRHTTGWVIHPRKSGKQRLQLPPLQYVRDGIVTHRFYPPSLTLDVQALPAYLPPDIPVGTLSLNAQWPSRLVLIDNLKNLRLQVDGQGIRQENLPSLQQQLASSSRLQFYPARREQQETTTAGALTSQHYYDIPLAAKTMGPVKLPDLRIDYFDPSSGRVKSRTIHGTTLYALYPWLAYLLGAGMILLMVWAMKAVLPPIYHYAWRTGNYYHVLSRLPQVESAEQIMLLLRKMAVNEGWPANLTLAQWLAYWQNRYTTSSSLSQAITGLIRYRYAAQPLDIRQIREPIYTALYQQHPLLGRLSIFTRKT